MKKVFVITLFPEYFDSLKTGGVTGQALNGDRADLELITVNPREFSNTNYKGVDDTPFGGGHGMIMRADVMANTVNSGIIEKYNLYREQLHIIYTAPRGEVWCDSKAQSLSKFYTTDSDKHLVFICGRYEGIDERFLENYVDSFFSLGDFILSGGEIAVMAIIDSSLRFIPGVLGNNASAMEDSFTNGMIEYPLYTKPREFEGKEVPEVLLSGHHAKITEYQKQQSIEMTKKYRPDLLDKKGNSNG